MARSWQKSRQLGLDLAGKTGGEVELLEGYQKPPMPRTQSIPDRLRTTRLQRRRAAASAPASSILSSRRRVSETPRRSRRKKRRNTSRRKRRKSRRKRR